MNSGIYQIVLKLDNRKYIGSSINVSRRLRIHLSKLKNHKHDNSYLQRVFDKYGESNFLFDLIENCPIENLLSLEKTYIDTLNTKNKKFGFNIQDPETGTLNIARHFYHPWNKKEIIKIFASESGKKNSITQRLNMSGSKTKLNWEIVRKIRSLVKEDKNINYSTISRLYNVDRSQISRIVNLRTWREDD